MVPSMFATIVEIRLDRDPIQTSSVCVVSSGGGKGLLLCFGQKIIMFLFVKQVFVRWFGGLVNNTVCVRSLYLLCVCVCK